MRARAPVAAAELPIPPPPPAPDDYDALLKQAKRAYRAGNSGKARALAEQALAKNPSGVGAMVLIWSGNGISELALLYVIGAYAVAFGVIAIGGAFWLPLDGGDRALIALYGLVSILFGIVMFARPGAGALVVLSLIAAFALVSGISQLVVAIGGKRLLESRAKKILAQPKPQTS